MPRSTRRLPHAFVRAAAVFALSAGVITPAVIHAPAAHADWDSTTGSTLDNGRYHLVLPSSALWVKVSVLASTAPDAAVLASTEAITSDSYSSWTPDEPFALPEGTALGDYPVRVEYRLPGETTKQWTGGTYSYRPHVGVTGLSWDRATTTYEQRKVVLSGRTTLWNPATGARTAAPEGTKVEVKLSLYDTAYRSQTLTATTGADGTFTLPMTPNATISNGSASVVTTGTVNDPDNAAYVPGVQAEAVIYRISSDVNKYRVLAGTNVQVSGHVERYTAGGWKPFPGAPVVATGREPNYSDATPVNQLGSGTSSATGTFSFSARAEYSTDKIYTFLRPSAYIQPGAYAFDRTDIAVPQQFSYGQYAITLDEYGRLVAKGQLGSSGYCATGEPTTLQASLDGGLTWRNLVSGRTNTYCQYTLNSWGYDSALYRVYHPETNQLVAKAGTALKRARTATRFSAFTISPTQPVVNGKMTVSGTVQRKLNGVWKPLGGVKLTLVYKPKGDTKWYWVTKDITTNSYGNFSYRATAYGDGSWALYLNTTGSYFYSETNAKYIDAR
ncbi:hypothetical protein [Streptomyces sp. NRRL B-24572]|uniref:hypothetical protein n=1 Tax=Streptomyces sp. NRRL B-24572 TaxID=1962156 RepID=UPI000A37B7BD|nr:hypothetical protein [Streptomyces sp. NRRL B-24572]